LFYIAEYLDLLPVILFLIFLKKCKPNTLIRTIFWVSLLSFVILKVADKIVPETNKHYFYSLFIAMEYSFFAFFLWRSLKNAAAKKTLIILSIVFICFLIPYTLFGEIKQIDSLSIGIESIIILSFCFYFLYELINQPTTSFIYNDYRFWIVMGFLLYLAGTFFFYIYAEQQSSLKELLKYWFLTWVFYIIKNILFAVGIIIFTRKPDDLKTTKSNSIPYLDMI
jgi:hypothetical protein